MKEWINVLVKHPGHRAFFCRVRNTLESLQGLVGGYIETVTLSEDLVLICNEEGLLRGLPDNCQLYGMRLVGSIVICGVDGEEFADLPADARTMERLFPEMWEV